MELSWLRYQSSVKKMNVECQSIQEKQKHSASVLLTDNLSIQREEAKSSPPDASILLDHGEL